MKVFSGAPGLGTEATDLQRPAQPLLEANCQLSKPTKARRGTHNEPATKLARPKEQRD